MSFNLPSGWHQAKIKNIAEVVGGGTPSTKDPENFGGDVPWITPKDLSHYNCRYIRKGERNITAKGLSSSSAKFLPSGSVLLTSRAPVGYLAIARNPVTTNQGFRSLILKKGYVPEFVYYLLKLNRERLESYASGSTFKELSGSALKELEFKFPPEEEQILKGVLREWDPISYLCVFDREEIELMKK